MGPPRRLMTLPRAGTAVYPGPRGPECSMARSTLVWALGALEEAEGGVDCGSLGIRGLVVGGVDGVRRGRERVEEPLAAPEIEADGAAPGRGRQEADGERGEGEPKGPHTPLEFELEALDADVGRGEDRPELPAQEDAD